MLARIRDLVRGLGSAGPWLLVAGGGPLLGLFVFTATYKTWLPLFADDMPSAAAFLAIGALLSAFCLVPTQLTSLVAGYLFGSWLGSIVGFLVAWVAAVIGFRLWSRVLGTRVLATIAQSPKAERVHRALFGCSSWRTTWLIALLRLSPTMPFAATNLLMAALGVRVWPFLLATAIGIAPRSVVVSLVGAELPEFDWQVGGNRWTTVLAIVATVVVLVLISRIARNALRLETNGES